MRQPAKIGFLVFAVVFGTTATGCGSDPPLHTETSAAGIRAAEEIGAAKVPRAALHLQLAKEALEYAKKLQADDEHRQATSMLARAEADAQLAVALSREDAQRAEAVAAMERVRKLREGNNVPVEGGNP